MATTPGRTMLPFAADSPWRLGIAKAASFGPDDDPRNIAIVDVGGPGQAWVNYRDYSHPITRATYTDPVARVTDTVHTSPDWIPAGGSWSTRIPPGARIAAGTDRHMHVIDAQGKVVVEHFGVTRKTPTAYTCKRRHAVDLMGSGIGPQNGCRAYGGSALGGLIRTWEVDPTHPAYDGTIRHPLAIALRLDQLHYAGATLRDNGAGAVYGRDGNGLAQGYVWPATEQDAASPTRYTGPIPMGSYFAIPPTVDVEKLGLRVDDDGRSAALMVARAAQDYGVYVTDASTTSASFYCQDDPAPAMGTFVTQLKGPSATAADLRRIFRALRVVTSNTATTPNGGPLGAPRRA